MTDLILRNAATVLCVAASLALAACASSGEPVQGCRDTPDSESNCRPASSYVDESEQWKEASVSLPALPAADDLVPIDAPNGRANVDYMVDRKSVSRGADGVMRYTVMVRSATGAENLFFEGIRCATNQVRQYAYAASEGGFRAIDADWKPAASRGVRGYQEYLLNHIMCDAQGYAWDPQRVVEALGSQHTAGGVSIERFCKDRDNCNPTGRQP